jgi:hypothetical protein
VSSGRFNPIRAVVHIVGIVGVANLLGSVASEVPTHTVIATMHVGHDWTVFCTTLSIAPVLIVASIAGGWVDGWVCWPSAWQVEVAWGGASGGGGEILALSAWGLSEEWGVGLADTRAASRTYPVLLRAVHGWVRCKVGVGILNLIGTVWECHCTALLRQKKKKKKSVYYLTSWHVRAAHPRMRLMKLTEN